MFIGGASNVFRQSIIAATGDPETRFKEAPTPGVGKATGAPVTAGDFPVLHRPQ